MSEQSVWGIHGGKTGDANDLFTRHNVIALGWDEVGDLSELPANREAFKALITETYPSAKPGALPIYAGQLFRFLYELQIGDLVVYPSKVDKLIHLGQLSGSYSYSPTPEQHYPHHRSIDWVKAIPRTHFSQGALYESGSGMSFFQIQNYADEYRAAIEGKAATEVPPEDETAALVSEEIEQATRDFVLTASRFCTGRRTASPSWSSFLGAW